MLFGPSNHLSKGVPQNRQVITAAGEANYTWITRSAKVHIHQTWNNHGKFKKMKHEIVGNLVMRSKGWSPWCFFFCFFFCSFISWNKKVFFGFNSKDGDFGGWTQKWSGKPEVPIFFFASFARLLASVAPKIAETCNVTADETCFWKELCRSCKGSPLSLWGDLNWKKPVWRFEPKMPSFCWKELLYVKWAVRRSSRMKKNMVQSQIS